MLASLACVLLASCATSETDVPFGFADSAPANVSSQSDDFARAAAAGETAPGAAADGQAAMLPDDPSLPDDVAFVPSLRPGEPGDAAAQMQAPPPEQTAAVQQQPAAPEQVDGEGDPPAAAVQAGGAGTEQPQQQQQATQFLENAPPEQVAALAPPPPKKRGLLSFFTSQPAPQAPRPQPERKVEAPAPAKPLVQLASNGPAKPIVAQGATTAMSALPGVRQNALFEITRRSGLDDDSDVDVYEGDELRVASIAPGMARLAPNGLMKQTDNVDVACLKPSLVRVLKTVEQRFGRKVIVTSGYRSPDRNRRARGARNSLHMYCAAADVQVPGVSKLALAQFVRSMPGRGGVGTYCHTESVHIDVGPERDWNWRCRRRK